MSSKFSAVNLTPEAMIDSSTLREGDWLILSAIINRIVLYFLAIVVSTWSSQS